MPDCLKRLFVAFVVVCPGLFSLPVSAAVEKPFLWRIHGLGDSYLFGTVHLPNPEVTDLPEWVIDALEGSDHFFAELDIAEMNRPEAAQAMMLPPGQHLRGILPAELAERTNVQLRTINPFLSLDTMGTMRVWAVAAALPILREQLRYPGEATLDVALYRRARAAGLTTAGLETIAEQVAVFENLSLANQIRMLEETVAWLEQEAVEGETMVPELIEWYLNGDADKFGELMERFSVGSDLMNDPEMVAFMEALMDGRNRVMAERIDSKLRAQPDEGFFFAVGAGHLGGETAIQRLLRERGWRVERVLEPVANSR